MSQRCQQPQAHPARCGCEQSQQRLLPATFIQPHPPRHWGFLQPEREVPGYTIEQMKEYGAQCAAEALRQNK
jgi:hypothetical protein